MIYKKMLGMLTACLIVFLCLTPASFAAEKNYDSLFVYIGDSLMKAKSGDQEAIVENMAGFESEWNALKNDSEQAKGVDEHLLQVKSALQKDAGMDEIREELSSLSSSLVAFDKAQNPVNKGKDKQKLQELLPLIDEMKATVSQGDTQKAKSQYNELLNKWAEAETFVRGESVVSYGEIEKYQAFIRIAVTNEPLDQESAQSNLDALQASIENVIAGNVKKADNAAEYSLTDITHLLEESIEAIEANQLDSAVTQLNDILTIWPMVEGDVSTRDSKLYSDMETKVPEAISLLSSKKVQVDAAKSILNDLNERLLPLTNDTSYSTWDAALILLREGLEALLIVVTLLSFLKKVNQHDKQKWIWIGVGVGLAASVVLSFIINMVFSQLTAASSREYIEGIIGIVAVVMMLTVGAWLHSKSNIHAWNQYIGSQMYQAIATGRLFSFALISFFSIFREGAETIIFYSGMAPYMSLKQMVSGIGIALAILIVIGFILIRYSVKLPITLFFKIATVMIYVLAFKILGVSIHALQVSQVLPTHSIGSPFIEWIGLYPTLETTLPQIVFVALILLTTVWVKKRNNAAAAA
ncbi:FTR1 family protein [Niallia oryzisoli]|uniref:FTR1 family protein n=1 Tax=Niallia oryzisoli TaxID=1737571 RepID=A0ABZ2CFS4_9BACI